MGASLKTFVLIFIFASGILLDQSEGMGVMEACDILCGGGYDPYYGRANPRPPPRPRPRRPGPPNIFIPIRG
ncbi:unnamed protein product [Orchesella dallaii]|uniref:Uncharacterized protein n=1 Tax=Orchesella dallaii TaxID=48710 RepID=A0ABP1REU3_9HEXA